MTAALGILLGVSLIGNVALIYVLYLALQKIKTADAALDATLDRLREAAEFEADND